MDANDRRPKPPPEARGEADFAPTTEFRAFLAGEPIATGAERPAAGREGWLARLRALFHGRPSR
jgi:hypothetical protein